MLKRFVTALALCATPLAAQTTVSMEGWEDITFFRLDANTYTASESVMKVESDDAVSIVWTRTRPELYDAAAADWAWSVEQSVPPTDLKVKGGDDRNLSLYFVFAGERTTARAERGAGLARVLRGDDVRILFYTFGGDQPRGSVFPSPYQEEQGSVRILREAITGAFTESVDLRADLGAAFGASDLNLIGIALSADSDDTDTAITAELRDITLR